MKSVLATTMIATTMAAERAVDRKVYGNLIAKSIKGEMSWQPIHPKNNMFTEMTLEQVKSYQGTILSHPPGPSLTATRAGKLRGAVFPRTLTRAKSTVIACKASATNCIVVAVGHLPRQKR